MTGDLGVTFCSNDIVSLGLFINLQQAGMNLQSAMLRYIASFMDIIGGLYYIDGFNYIFISIAHYYSYSHVAAFLLERNEAQMCREF